MKQKEFLKEVIDLAFNYIESNSGDPDIRDFSGFLTQILQKPVDNSKRAEGQINTETDDLSIRLVLLNRYAGEYVKLALEDTPLQTGDEFSFLVSLFAAGSHTKTELINTMMLSKTSGTEVLKRLHRKSLIVEYEDSNDKRSKRVDLSDEGRQLVAALLPQMAKVSEIVRGNLDEAELRSANFLLRKLHDHHQEIFQSSTKESIKNRVKLASDDKPGV